MFASFLFIVCFCFVVPLLGCSLDFLGFPGGSDGKESACNQETWVQSLVWEDPLEKGIASIPLILPGESHGQRNLESYYSPWTHKELDMIEQLTFSAFSLFSISLFFLLFIWFCFYNLSWVLFTCLISFFVFSFPFFPCLCHALVGCWFSAQGLGLSLRVRASCPRPGTPENSHTQVIQISMNSPRGLHLDTKIYMLCAQSFQSCLTLCDPMDCSPPGSSVHRILQAKILERVVMLSFRGSSQPRDQTCISYVSWFGREHSATWEDLTWLHPNGCRLQCQRPHTKQTAKQEHGPNYQQKGIKPY